MAYPLAVGTRVIDRRADVGTDMSNAPPALLGATPLVEFWVHQPGGYAIQNQSADPVQVVYDDGQHQPSIYLLSANADAAVISWFVGRIRIFGAAGSQLFVRSQ